MQHIVNPQIRLAGLILFLRLQMRVLLEFGPFCLSPLFGQEFFSNLSHGLQNVYQSNRLDLDKRVRIEKNTFHAQILSNFQFC